ncbi:hypothetical protein SLEP1_g39689 [Rubroshorea leprosula]|uniref:Uncharacterized protein n=1 Tax=Rubroshorea leprosula TaxID=152421 RepID=A0AAV5L1G2_9ROSI|nr:hypothetical protein SLEP1_g39689 [Rubroshorea leprosula]
MDEQASYRFVNGSISKVAWSKDLCHLIVMCARELNEDNLESTERQMGGRGRGLHCFLMDTYIFWKR